MPYPRFFEQRRVLGLRLRHARESRGLKQAEVAAALGYPQTHISKCEKGQRRMDVFEVLEFARLYDLRVEDLALPPTPRELKDQAAYEQREAATPPNDRRAKRAAETKHATSPRAPDAAQRGERTRDTGAAPAAPLERASDDSQAQRPRPAAGRSRWPTYDEIDADDRSRQAETERLRHEVPARRRPPHPPKGT